MLNPDIFKKKLEQNISEKITFLKQVDPQIVTEVMNGKNLLEGKFYDEKNIFNIKALQF